MGPERPSWPLAAHPARLLLVAQRNLLAHKLRSSLSILGVVFGVAAVVAMSSVGEGARRQALREVEGLGIDTVTLRVAHAPEDDEADAEAPHPERFRAEDAQALMRVVPKLVATAPVTETTSSLASSERRLDATIVATAPEYARIMSLRLGAGRFLTTLDVSDRKRSAILGATLARSLFPVGDALGARLRIDDQWFVVVGVLAGRDTPRGRGGPIRARDVNRAVLIPWSVLRLPEREPDEVDELVLRAQGHESVSSVARAADGLVRRLRPQARFTAIVPREILRQRQRTQSIFDLVTGTIAAVSLLVGGIGIMNIMLATVAERTAEIGLRRAVGATQADVALQFVVEGALLTTSGGALGAAVGIIGSWIIHVGAGWPTALSATMLVVALMMAAAVGVGFSLYPAWHASRLQPMHALRTE